MIKLTIVLWSNLRREPIQVSIGRTEQTKHLVMKSLQPQNLGLQAGPNADVQQIDALKALKNPAHGGVICRLVELIGNGLGGMSELAAQSVFRQTIDQ